MTPPSTKTTRTKETWYRHRIGVFGAGMIGETLAGLWRRAGHEVMISSRHPETLADLASALDVAHGSVEDAARFGDVWLLAVPFKAIPSLSAQLAEFQGGKHILDACNPIPRRDGPLATDALAHHHGSGWYTAARFPVASVAKAFNTVYFAQMKTPRTGAERIGVPVASDDELTLDIACQLIEDAGMVPVWTGNLTTARSFEFGTPVWNSAMTAAALRDHLPHPGQ